MFVSIQTFLTLLLAVERAELLTHMVNAVGSYYGLISVRDGLSDCSQGR